MFVMLFGYPPFYADQEAYGQQTDDRIFALVKKGFEPVTKDGFGPHFPKTIPSSESAKDLIAKLLTLDTAKRITASEALEHPWLTGEKAENKPMMGTVINNLNTFSHNYKFKQALLTVMADTMTDDELSNLKKTFAAMDENGDGVITVQEMKNAIQKWGGGDAKNQDNEFLMNLMKTADVDGDGALSYSELLVTCVQRKVNAKEERLWNAFCKLDLNGDGRVTKDEIEQVLGATDAKTMISEVDKNGDGSIDYEEFMDMWSNKQESADYKAAAAAHVAQAQSQAQTQAKKQDSDDKTNKKD